MHWQGARAVVAVVAMGVMGSWRFDAAPAAPDANERCVAAVVLRAPSGAERLVCRLDELRSLLSICPPLGPVRRGDRLAPGEPGPGCRMAVEPLPAARRLRLGVRLDINDAAADELTRVSGIGPRTAARIVAGRPWPSVPALDAVKGIGPRRLAHIAPSLRASVRPLLWPSRPRHAASSPRRP